MNLLRPITIDSTGNERNNDAFHHYKTLKWKISAIRGKILSNYACLISEDKAGELTIKLHIVIITIISTSNISSSSFALTVPREKRNFFVTRYVQNIFVTSYVQVLVDLNSTKQTQFTVSLAFGL